VAEEYLGAMPKLVGAPAYARPPRAVVVDRPFDPDDLPIEAHRTASDYAFLASIGIGSSESDRHDDGPGSLLKRAFQPFSRREGHPAESRS
jgi:hypothetical protein